MLTKEFAILVATAYVRLFHSRLVHYFPISPPTAMVIIKVMYKYYLTL